MLTINNTVDGYLKNVQIKGNTVQDPVNLSSIKSVGTKVEGQDLYEIPLLSVGKNINKSGFVLGTINTSGVWYDDNSSICSSDFIRVKSDFNYTYSRFDGIIGIQVVYYDKEKKYISRNSNTTASSWTYLAPPNTMFVKFILLNTRKTETRTQIEEGSQATPYEQYQENKLTILSPVQIEKVGDVVDRIVEKDGVWGVEKNIGMYCQPLVFSNINTSLQNTYYSEITRPSNFNNLFLKGSSANDKTILYLSDSSAIRHLYNHNDNEHFFLEGDKIKVHLNKTRVDASKGDTILEKFNNLFIDCFIRGVLSNPQFIPLPHSQQIKLRTFSNRTNISFLTEIEGTIKADVPKSIGATVNVHTKEIDNIYTELDRVKKLEQSTVSTVTTDKDFVSVQETTQGYFEDVELKGRTLVNCHNLKSTILTSGCSVVGNSIKYSYKGSQYSNFFCPDKTLIKPNTLYTFVVDVTKNTLDSGSLIYITSKSGNGKEGKDIFTDELSKNITIKGGVVGRFAYKRTSLDIDFADYVSRSFVFDNNSQGEFELTIVILEGDHTQSPPNGYFEGLKSVGDGTDEIVVSSCNNRCFGGEQYIHNKIVDSKGELLNNSNCFAVDYFKVQPNERLYHYLNGELTLTNWFFYDKNKSFVKSQTDAFTNLVIPENVHYVRTYCGYPSNENKLNINVVITNSDTCINGKTDKKKLLYFDPTDNTWKKPILRELDTVEKHSDGKYYYHKRSEIVVLNGSDDINITEWIKLDNTLGFMIKLNGIKPANDFYARNVNILSDKFATTTKSVNVYENLDEELIGIRHEVNNSAIKINRSKLSAGESVAGFKAWLQANNVTVVYQLATEKVYECTNIDLITYENETNFTVKSGVLSPKSTLKVHNNIANVVSLLQKKVSLLESNISSYMITQNRLQLNSTYSADQSNFKIDVAVMEGREFEAALDYDLLRLIKHNVLVGKDNYDRAKIEEMLDFYVSLGKIDYDMWDEIWMIMELQDNPPFEEVP